MLNNMRARADILDEVLGINKEIERLQDEINNLFNEAKLISDKDDDDEYLKGQGYLACIMSYYNLNYSR